MSFEEFKRHSEEKMSLYWKLMNAEEATKESIKKDKSRFQSLKTKLHQRQEQERLKNKINLYTRLFMNVTPF